MGLFLCDVCNQQLGTPPHVCNREDIKKYVDDLEERATTAEFRLNDVKNAVLMVLEQLQSIEGEEVTVKTEWLKKLWAAAKCQWYEAKDASAFLKRYIALHRILCEAFDLFRTKKGETLLLKLKNLREACDSANSLLGYEKNQIDKLSLTPEDIVNSVYII